MGTVVDREATPQCVTCHDHQTAREKAEVLFVLPQAPALLRNRLRKHFANLYKASHKHESSLQRSLEPEIPGSGGAPDFLDSCLLLGIGMSTPNTGMPPNLSASLSFSLAFLETKQVFYKAREGCVAALLWGTCFHLLPVHCFHTKFQTRRAGKQKSHS